MIFGFVFAFIIALAVISFLIKPTHSEIVFDIEEVQSAFRKNDLFNVYESLLDASKSGFTKCGYHISSVSFNTENQLRKDKFKVEVLEDYIYISWDKK